jgi:integrase
VSEFCEASAKLHGRTLGEAVEGSLRTVASVKRKDVSEAAEELIASAEPLTRASEGQRAQVSPKYHYNRSIMLRRFASTFPGNAASDLAKEHLDAFIQTALAGFSAKSRNHHRAAVRQFLQWCVRKDYLSATHRLGEADAMRPERANNGEIHFYTPGEFRALLEAAEGPMRAMIAIGGLAGLRTTELLRLDWADVRRVKGHIEVTAGKAKTRQRRLVEICPALAAWLQPFRTFTTGKLCTLHEITWQQHFVKLCEKAGVERKPNGLRHAFCTYHFAAHANENLTAQQAGNSPAMVHAHYKGLATKAEAEKWFVVKPARSANLISLPVRKNAH